MKVSQNPSQFGGERHSDSGGILFSVFHVILQADLTKESCNFMGRSP